MEGIVHRAIRSMAVKAFPGGTVDRNPPASAGDTGSIPGLGRFHMPKAAKPVHHNSRACMLQSLRPVCLEPGSAAREATAVNSLCTPRKNSPSLLQVGKAHAQPPRPRATKNK